MAMNDNVYIKPWKGNSCKITLCAFRHPTLVSDVLVATSHNYICTQGVV